MSQGHEEECHLQSHPVQWAWCPGYHKGTLNIFPAPSGVCIPGRSPVSPGVFLQFLLPVFGKRILPESVKQASYSQTTRRNRSPGLVVNEALRPRKAGQGGQSLIHISPVLHPRGGTLKPIWSLFYTPKGLLTQLCLSIAGQPALEGTRTKSRFFPLVFLN